jgi:hypothetical protein
MELTGQKKIMTMETTRCIWSLNMTFSKFCNPSESLAVKVIALFKWRVIFRLCSQKAKKFWLSGCTNYVTSLATPATMQVYLGKGEHGMAQQLMATIATVTGLMRKIGQPQIICWQCFVLLWNFGDLTKKKWSSGTVELNRTGMPED